MADSLSDATGGETPVNNQDLCDFCRGQGHKVEECKAAEVCNALNWHASVYIASQAQENVTWRGWGVSDNTDPDEKICVFCQFTGHDMKGCPLAREFAELVCKFAGPLPQLSDQPVPRATEKPKRGIKRSAADAGLDTPNNKKKRRRGRRGGRSHNARIARRASAARRGYRG